MSGENGWRLKVLSSFMRPLSIDIKPVDLLEGNSLILEAFSLAGGQYMAGEEK